MAKAKSKSKKNNSSLIINIIIIALAVLTICTLFMPIFNSHSVATSLLNVTANGADAFSAAFASELSSEMSEGAALLYAFKAAEETAFVTNVALWGYMLTVIVSVATLAFAILNILGFKFKLINTILGVALIVLALVTFIFAIIVASQNTEITEVLGKETGTRTIISAGIYMLIATIIGGGLQVYQARKK